MDLTGEPGGAPQKIGVALADIMTGLYAVIAIQAALHMRTRTGRGQQIDMALLDTMTGVLANQAMNYLASGVTPTRLGNAHPNIVPYAAFPASDGWFILAVGNDGQFRRFAKVVGIDGDDPRYATNALRCEHRATLTPVIEAATARGRATNCWPHWKRRRSGGTDQYGRTGLCRPAGRGAWPRHPSRAPRWIVRAGRPHPDPLFRCRPVARPCRADAGSVAPAPRIG